MQLQSRGQQRAHPKNHGGFRIRHDQLEGPAVLHLVKLTKYEKIVVVMTVIMVMIVIVVILVRVEA